MLQRNYKNFFNSIYRYISLKLPFNRIMLKRPGALVFENSPEYQAWIDKEKNNKKDMPDLGLGVIAIAEHYHTHEDMVEGFVDRADKNGNFDTPDKELAKSIIKQYLPQYERGIKWRLEEKDKGNWRVYAYKMLLDPDSKDFKEILGELYAEVEEAKPENEYVSKAERQARAAGTFKEPEAEADPFEAYVPKKKRK